MAAFGILAALRERDRSGEGQLVDVSMADGALSWLAMVAGRYFADGERAAARRARAGGRAHLLPALRVQRRLRDARRARAEVLAGVVPRRRPRGPDREAVRAPGLRGARRGRADLPRAHARRVAASSPRSTTAASSRCSTSTRRSTPSSCARARWWSSSTSRAPPSRCGSSASPVKLSRTPGGPQRPGPGARRAHARGARRRSATRDDEIARARGGRAPWPGRPRARRGASCRERRDGNGL